MDLLVWELLVPIDIEDEPATPVNKKRDPVLDLLVWELLDSNQRPPACKAGALNQLS